MFSEDDSFFNRIDLIHKFCGIYIPNKKDGKLYTYTYLTIIFFCHIYATFYIVCEVMVVERMHNLQRIFKFLSLHLSHLLGMLKVILILLCKERIDRVKANLQDDRYVPEPIGDFQPGEMFKKAEEFVTKFATTVLIVYNMVPTSGFISSLVNLSLKQKDEYFNGNITCFDYLPYFHVIPFKTPTKTSCQLALINMYGALVIQCNYITAYDILFVSTTVCIATKMKIVCGAAETIRERVLLKLNLPQNYKVFRDEENPQLEKAMYKEQQDCSDYLSFLLDTCQEVESMFTYLTLAQVVLSLLVLASSLYSFTVVSFDDPEFFSILCLFSAVMTQLSMICYFGNGISEQSSSFAYSLYKGNWLSSSKRFKQGMIITMSRMQKNVYLTIGKFSPLTLATWLSVVKGSFSYVTVFRTVEN